MNRKLPAYMRPLNLLMYSQPLLRRDGQTLHCGELDLRKLVELERYSLATRINEPGMVPKVVYNKDRIIYLFSLAIRTNLKKY